MFASLFKSWRSRNAAKNFSCAQEITKVIMLAEFDKYSASGKRKLFQCFASFINQEKNFFPTATQYFHISEHGQGRKISELYKVRVQVCNVLFRLRG